MAAPTEAEKEIARLTARIEALEAALERRSQLLRLLQRYLSARDLVLLSRLADGLAPLPWSEQALESWRETTELTPSEVEEALTNLWASLAPVPLKGSAAS